MSLNVKNPETVALVAALAGRLGTTQVQAITQAVQAKLTELDRPAPSAVDELLETIWASQDADERGAVRQRLKALYDEAGVPA